MVGAVVLLVINATYFGALRLHNSTNARVDSDLELDRTLKIIQRDVAGLMVPAAANATAPVGTFSGQFQDTPTNSLTQEFTYTRVSPDFYTTSGVVDGWNQFSEVQIVAYFLAPAATGSTKNLVRAVTRNLLPVNTPTTDEQILLTGVVDANFQYYDGTQWDTTWDSTVTSTLPTDINFNLTLFNGSSNSSAQQPIQLVMPVMVTTTTTAKLNAQATSSGGGSP